MVVGSGFEPEKALARRFTVSPRWPLEYPTKKRNAKILDSRERRQGFFRSPGCSSRGAPHPYQPSLLSERAVWGHFRTESAQDRAPLPRRAFARGPKLSSYVIRNMAVFANCRERRKLGDCGAFGGCRHRGFGERAAPVERMNRTRWVGRRGSNPCHTIHKALSQIAHVRNSARSR